MQKRKGKKKGKTNSVAQPVQVHYGLHTGELSSPNAHGDDDQIRFRLNRIQDEAHRGLKTTRG